MMLKITEKRRSGQKAENSLVFPRHHRFIFQGELALSCSQHLVSRLVNINAPLTYYSVDNGTGRHICAHSRRPVQSRLEVLPLCWPADGFISAANVAFAFRR